MRLLAAVLFVLSSPLQAQKPSAPAPATNPTLVVLVTVDALRPDYYERFRADLTGGLARLHERGAVFTNAYQDHAITETAPGHAATLSGRFPVRTGILSNVEGVRDTSVTLIGGGGAGASPARFRGSTLADWMLAKNPATKILSVSRKDRGAILPIGRSKQHVYWYAANGNFTTSTYYRAQLPPWVRKFNDRGMPASYAGRAWTPLLPAAAYLEPDSVPYENGGEAFTFPHVVPSEVPLATSVMGSFPWIDDVTLSFALEGVKQLGLGATARTDLLAVSLSATDGIGHLYGPDSREIHDQILRLDRNLGAFLDSLDALRGAEKILVVLTSDHGMQPYPETTVKDPRARRVDAAPVVARLVSEIRRAGGSPRAVDFGEGVLRIDRARIGRADADRLTSRFASEMRRLPGVARVDRLSDLAKADTVTDAVARRWLHVFTPGSPGVELLVTLEPFSYWRTSGAAQHGSPHDADARVPIIFHGRGIRSGHRDRTVRVVDIAPTLASFLRIRPAEALDGVVLGDVFR